VTINGESFARLAGLAGAFSKKQVVGWQPFCGLCSTAELLTFQSSMRQSTQMQLARMNHTFLLVLAGTLWILFPGCKEKPKAAPVIEKSRTSAQEAGAAIKDAAQKTGNVVGDAAQNVWAGLKIGAREVSHVATNVAGEVKTGAVKVGETVKEATR
jgi:hypothetical protein